MDVAAWACHGGGACTALLLLLGLEAWWVAGHVSVQGRYCSSSRPHVLVMLLVATAVGGGGRSRIRSGVIIRFPSVILAVHMVSTFTNVECILHGASKGSGLHKVYTLDLRGPKAFQVVVHVGRVLYCTACPTRCCPLAPVSSFQRGR